MDTERFEHAIALRDAGRVAEALQVLVALTETTSDPEEKASLLGNQTTCLLILGRYQDARKRLASARRIAPKTQAHLYLDFEDANLSSHEGSWDKALHILERLQRNYGQLLLTAEHHELYEQVRIEEKGCQVPFSGKKISCSIRSWEESGGWMLAAWFTTP
jgi:tetratricopeptide (TPR) repeat protein